MRVATHSFASRRCPLLDRVGAALAFDLGPLLAVFFALAACTEGSVAHDASRMDAPRESDATPLADAVGGDSVSARDVVTSVDAHTTLACNTHPGGPRAGAAASTTLWPVAAAIDGDPSTVWSSVTHATAQNVESLTVSYATAQRINYVVLAPRTDAAGHALGFPVEFTVEWSDGTTWAAARGFTHYPRPTAACVALSLPDAVSASAIRVTARVLGDDGVGNYVFQLAELDAGYDPAGEGTTYAANRATGSSELWPAMAAFDGDASTAWSSVTHASAASTEWLAYWWSDLRPVNYVQWTPRVDSTGRAQGFPVAFDVLYSDGSRWVMAQHYAGFPTPHDNMPIVLPLGSTVMANGIQIVASTLGQDALGNNVFQLAEVTAGVNPGYELFRFGGNNGASGRNEIANVGSESVDRPEQLANWNFDTRGIVLAPAAGSYQNIYAPSIVHTTGTGWNVYFGGWDGSPSPNDRLYRTSSGDDFLSFGPHALIVDHGAFVHTNNDCALRVADGDWRIVYTADAALNKPAWSHSSDGLTWSPGVGTASSLFNMTGYPSWGSADVNGGNVVLRDDAGTWHLYFDDFAGAHVVHHATSTDFVNWTYQGHALEQLLVMNDFKSFAYGNTRYYVGLYHFNSQHVWMTVGTSLSALPAPTVAFDNAGDADHYIVAVGMVQDGSRIYGALYGAGAVSSLDHNRIFARWLQKRVIFQNARVRWGDIEQGLGPERIYLFTAAPDSVETGRFAVYDTDGTTLLFNSPPITMRAGDVWSYTAGY